MTLPMPADVPPLAPPSGSPCAPAAEPGSAHPGARLLAAVVGSLLAGVITSAGAMWLVFLLVDDPTSDPSAWEELGDVIVAGFLGLGAGLSVFIGAVIASVRWALPRGRRAAATLVILATGPALPVVLLFGGDAGDRGGSPSLGAVVAVAGLVGLGALVALAGGVGRPRMVGGVLLACVSVGIVAFGFSSAVGPAVDDQRKADALTQSRVPLALFDGRTLESPLPDLTLLRVSSGSTYSTVRYERRGVGTNGAGRTVELSFGDQHQPWCVTNRTRLPCDEVGRRPDGRTIWGDPLDRTAGPPRYRMVWVDMDGGRWAVRPGSSEQAIGVVDAVALLTALQPVDARTYVDAT